MLTRGQSHWEPLWSRTRALGTHVTWALQLDWSSIYNIMSRVWYSSIDIHRVSPRNHPKRIYGDKARMSSSKPYLSVADEIHLAAGLATDRGINNVPGQSSGQLAPGRCSSWIRPGSSSRGFEFVWIGVVIQLSALPYVIRACIIIRHLTSKEICLSQMDRSSHRVNHGILLWTEYILRVSSNGYMLYEITPHLTPQKPKMGANGLDSQHHVKSLNM